MSLAVLVSLKLQDLPVSVFPMLGLKACATTLNLLNELLLQSKGTSVDPSQPQSDGAGDL